MVNLDRLFQIEERWEELSAVLERRIEVGGDPDAIMTFRYQLAYLKENYPGREAEVLAQLSAYQPVGRMGKPAEVAAMALYLASDEAAMITGNAFPLDGGKRMG